MLDHTEQAWPDDLTEQAWPDDVDTGKVAGISAGQVKSIIDRVERLHSEKKGIESDISDVFKEAKSIRRVPGLSVRSAVGQTIPRGFKRVGSVLYGAYSGGVVSIAEDWSVTYIGPLDGEAPVDWAVNNRTPVPDVVCVSENGAFTVSPSGVLAFADGDLPQPISVCEMDGYFIFLIADGRMFASGLNATTINSLDNARAESRQGGLVRGVTFSGQLFAFKTTSCEVWSNTANATGFPFSRAAVIDRGLLAPRAVAGVQEGFATALIWVGDDGAVNTLNGYQAQPISTPDVERSIASLSDKSTLRAYGYTFDGQAIWSLSAPSFTWEYNLRTGRWHERASKGLSRWRGSETVNFAGKWLCGDLLSSNVMEISASSFAEGRDEHIFESESIQTASFPTPYRVGKTQFYVTVGVGSASGTDPTETAPRLLVQYSDDAGATWSNTIECEIGGQGESRRRVTLPRKLGRTGPSGRRWRVRVSDPVRVGLLGGDMEVLKGRA